MNKTILIIFSLISLFGCSKKEEKPMSIVGSYRVASSKCGIIPTEFSNHNFKGICFSADGSGYESHVSSSKSFKYVIDGRSLLITYYNATIPITLPFNVSNDTLYITHKDYFCEKLKLGYVQH